MSVALITGCSTGIGSATALHFARNGYGVFATMRDPATGSDALLAAARKESLPIDVLQLDVDSGASVASAVAAAVSKQGSIDVLVNNAGIGVGGPIETVSDADARRVFETNFFGALRMIRAVLPAMRERRSGAIVNVTSQGGRVTFASAGIYCASKFALEAASESLAIEVAPFGVRVVIIEPGVVLTPIFGKTEGSGSLPDPSYERDRRRFVINVASLLKQPTTPEDCARVILDAITTDRPRLRHTVGSEAAALLANRAAMTDEHWIATANIESEEEYVRAMSKVWGDKSRLF